MTTETIPTVSTYLSLQIDLLNGTEPLDVELAGVRWVSGRRFGLEFIRISPEILVRLRAFEQLLIDTP